MPQNPECPHCHVVECVIKNGRILDKQRYKCKRCGLQFTRTTPRGRSAEDKTLAVLLYRRGLSLRSVARLLQVSPPAVLRWVRLSHSGGDRNTPELSSVISGIDAVLHHQRADSASLPAAEHQLLHRLRSDLLLQLSQKA